MESDNQMDIELKNIVALYKTAASLKELPRQGWIMEGASQEYSDSVASHSFCVALVSYLVSNALLSRDISINTDKVTKMAIFHDLGESATGEIATGVKKWMEKYFSIPRAVEKMEHELLALLVEDVGVKVEFQRLIEEFDENNTKESKVVKFADVFDAFGHAKERLNKTFPEYLESSREKLRKSDNKDTQKVGEILAKWLVDIEKYWDDIERKRPWAMN